MSAEPAMNDDEGRPAINIDDGPEFYRVKSNRFMSRLRLLQHRGIATDLLVKVEVEEFHLHKVVLADWRL